jgi:hypothetical protein
MTMVREWEMMTADETDNEGKGNHQGKKDGDKYEDQPTP